MCGIAGIVSESETEIGGPLKRMLESMKHRGPDGAGFVIGGVVERGPRLEDLPLEGRTGRVALGHVRLAITGGATGVQPFQSRDGRLALLHNGETFTTSRTTA